MYTNDAELKVRYAETDQMGVVYHGNYYTWFEVGRTGFFNSLGYSYKNLEDDGIILPVIESSCKYIHPAKYYDDIIVRTSLLKLKGVRLTFNYQIIRKSDGKLLAEGKTVHAFVDKNLKPVKIKRFKKDMYDMLEKCIG